MYTVSEQNVDPGRRKLSPPLLPRLEPATFQSRVWSSTTRTMGYILHIIIYYTALNQLNECSTHTGKRRKTTTVYVPPPPPPIPPCNCTCRHSDSVCLPSFEVLDFNVPSTAQGHHKTNQTVKCVPYREW